MKQMILRTVRTDFGKRIRKAYESGDLKISRHSFLTYEPRLDGLANTISTVTKDNLVMVIDDDPNKERNEAGIHPNP